ncbi:Aspartyl/asparaginyl beta-hydroxylase (Aspartate beta-hydroxylase) (ASP beta-hydroxylase) (Peptide-aspartate beta-dioxygenase) [Durusdinium trenchii]|uniref:Aspartyl/asparaginyl beta-hydroxylase (Aspartate beta-hydroxylase) (ASP beta-hydroxylase) (Peptide-aspartate beta-dioxygenase) n=1 Tax=Durusdinium trenchii TaxID=1381693 RepID=A0ABP0MWU4_9DINO
MKDLELYPLIARLSLMLARHEQCLAEFDWKGELQERASMFHYETALQLLKTVSHFQEAQEIFNEATSLRRAGQQMIHWKHLWQTPSVYVRQLRPTGGTAWWDPKELPLAQVLEENVLDIRAELQMLLENGGRMVVDPAYPRLTTEGDWDVIRLYNDKKWDPAATTLAPKTVALLKERLPGQANGLPYIHHNTEEVCFFRMSPGTRILLHTGGCNARLNLSLGLMGCSDSFITVAQEERRWRDGQLFAFDDSCDHAARHDGPEVAHGPWAMSGAWAMMGNDGPWYTKVQTEGGAHIRRYARCTTHETGNLTCTIP